MANLIVHKKLKAKLQNHDVWFFLRTSTDMQVYIYITNFVFKNFN